MGDAEAKTARRGVGEFLYGLAREGEGVFGGDGEDTRRGIPLHSLWSFSGSCKGVCACACCLYLYLASLTSMIYHIVQAHMQDGTLQLLSCLKLMKGAKTKTNTTQGNMPRIQWLGTWRKRHRALNSDKSDSPRLHLGLSDVQATLVGGSDYEISDANSNKIRQLTFCLILQLRFAVLVVKVSHESTTTPVSPQVQQQIRMKLGFSYSRYVHQGPGYPRSISTLRISSDFSNHVHGQVTASSGNNAAVKITWRRPHAPLPSICTP
ncbi:uncharacterized protein CLUP02_02320 [Colletotrichum lupini]|uniref:Uncharacterized protein n=1 Tax=Colletotrichum lupini TaxID=145971 RepID=A0A9Q8SE15_9PEZI|nr:uncharacterized protein CLUP02_02320 [Colletotrichum lupini]UQC75664.1 hypothetical protein CLUP02_02320 [Colletotrichum lupini]